MYPKMLAQLGVKINTQNGPKIPKKLLISAVLIAMQSAIIWLLFLQALFAIATNDNSDFLATVFLAGILFFAGLWSSNIVLGLIRLKPWSYSAAIVLQLLAAAIGTASFLGEFGSYQIGFAILLPALAIFVMLLGKGVRELFARS